jgi:hypothetical protein
LGLIRALPKIASVALLLLVVVLTCVNPSSSNASYRPSVKLECVEAPCGSNPSRNEWRGYYLVKKTNFPASTEVVITAIKPNGEPYPFSQYSHQGELYGVRGNVEYTDQHGLLPDFKWATYNPGGQVDPPGLYHLRFRFKIHSTTVVAQVPMRMARLR